jgi:hypothetical protein
VPEIDRQQAEGQRVAFRADAAFARPEIYETLEARGVQLARASLVSRYRESRQRWAAISDLAALRPPRHSAVVPK